MPPKSAKKAASGDAGDRKQPTAQEAYLFYTIIKNMKGKPEVDWAAVAADAGFKNAETAKVRYGQIKRKLGMDTWNVGKSKEPKDDGAGDDGSPQTPAAARTRRGAATPASGTGAGIKKRTSATKRAPASTPSARSRKAKTLAIVKLEEDAAAQDLDDDNDEDDEIIDLSPALKKKGTAGRIKTEPGNGGGKNGAINFTIPEYATFPPVLPEAVLERQAILVHFNGDWTVSPVSIDVHAQWLARLPAHMQTQFYAQAQKAKNGGDGNKNNTNNNANNNVNTNAKTKANGSGNGNPFGLVGNNNNANTNANAKANGSGNDNPFGFVGDNNDATAQAQLLSEHFDAANISSGMMPMSMLGMAMPMGLGMGMGMGMGMGGYLSAPNPDPFGPGTNSNLGHLSPIARQGTFVMGSIPMHPSFEEQMEGEESEEREEREAREQEERDGETLFGLVRDEDDDDDDGFC